MAEPVITFMPQLFYAMGQSADGYIAGPHGEIDWAAPDEELHRFHNAQMRVTDLHVCGRRLYEEMLPWERDTWTSEPEIEFSRIWQALPKLVFSRTLDRVEGNTRLATRSLEDEIADLPDDMNVAVGGAGLAGECLKLGLIDAFHLFINPVLVGGGTPYFPPLATRVNLELAETRTFGSRVVYLRYVRL
jgi:dihydrofolate reductase